MRFGGGRWKQGEESLPLEILAIMSVEQRSASRPRIGLICFSAIPDDPRVRRQGDLFHSRGWDVVAVGLPGAKSPLPEWRCLALDDMRGLAPSGDASAGGESRSDPADRVELNAGSAQSSGQGAGRVRRHLSDRWPNAARTPLGRVALSFLRRLFRAKDVALVYLNPHHAEKTYWTLNDRFRPLHALAAQERVDIWLANDWTAMPIARQLAAAQGVPYAYDTHELAVDEYAQRLIWRLTQRPVIAAIEKEGIAGAAVTSCVSQGIADRLHALYRLPEKPLLIRNMPRYEAHPFRPSGERIAVLYHGVVNEGRGLEACIDSVSLWRPEFHLTIRGPGPAAYLDSLAARIRAAGLEDRVSLAPAVPMVDLVREAAEFDIGLFALPGHSAQNVHVLPNKFFEYAMAGLALCVSDLPEMTALLSQHDLGRSIPQATPQAIAVAINSFTRVDIDACKRRSLEAAKLLNWEAESDRLFKAIERVAISAGRAGHDAPR